VQAAGGTVIQWRDGVCTEAALCAQLDGEGLNAFIAAAVNASDDPAGAAVSYVDQLTSQGAPKKDSAEGIETLDVTTWARAGVGTADARNIVSETAKRKSWFKRVDKGRALGHLILDCSELMTGDVAEVVAALRKAIYARPAGIDVECPDEEVAAADATAVAAVAAAPETSSDAPQTVAASGLEDV
jgi:hypothetical protein